MYENIEEFRNETRPGDIIIFRINEQGLTISDFLEKSGLKEGELLDIFAGTLAITEEMDDMIGHALNSEPGEWAKRQQAQELILEGFLEDCHEFIAKDLNADSKTRTEIGPIDESEILEVIRPIIERVKNRVNNNLTNDLTTVLGLGENNIMIDFEIYQQARSNRKSGESKDETGTPDLIDKITISTIAYAVYRYLEVSQLFKQ